MAFGGRGGGAAPPLLLRSGRRRIEVAGRFDRVDVAPDGGAVAVDYKLRWRGEGFGAEDLEEGLGGADLQVPLYLLALRDSLGLRPAGVEIAEIGSGVVAGVRVEGAPGSVAPGEGSAVLDGARVAALEAAVREAAGAAAEALARGEIPARPSDPGRCGAGACPFADLCRHEKWDPRGRGGPWR
jgi:hypothetical protein